MAVLKYKKDGVWYPVNAGGTSSGSDLPNSTASDAGSVLTVSAQGKPVWIAVTDAEEEEY